MVTLKDQVSPWRAARRTRPVETPAFATREECEAWWAAHERRRALMRAVDGDDPVAAWLALVEMGRL